MHDFLVIGGGINGLLLARELSAEGASVVLLEKGRCGQEASWAGGGIVSPLYPWRYSAPVTALANWAQAFYPELATALLAETGIDVELESGGLLMLDAQDSDAALAWSEEQGRQMHALSADQCYAREKNLAPGYRSALWMPQVANVRNPRLLKALIVSLMQQPNVTLREQAQITQIRRQGERVSELEFNCEGQSQRIVAGQVIVCAGAWSAHLLAMAQYEDSSANRVAPVKGQMLAFQLPKKPCEAILLAAGRYVIPRRDGLVLVGSTLEHTGFDKAISDAARVSLQQSAAALLPCLADEQPVAQWAGLRPGAPHGVPYIGRVAPGSNMWISAGQYRNGLVLAPASARLLADCLLGRKPIVDPQPYLPQVLA